jgi:hypothetical protein
VDSIYGQTLDKEQTWRGPIALKCSDNVRTSSRHWIEEWCKRFCTVLRTSQSSGHTGGYAIIRGVARLRYRGTAGDVHVASRLALREDWAIGAALTLPQSLWELIREGGPFSSPGNACTLRAIFWVGSVGPNTRMHRPVQLFRDLVLWLNQWLFWTGTSVTSYQLGDSQRNIPMLLNPMI